MYTDPYVMFEDVGGATDGRHVVHDELAVGGEEVASLVQLLDASLVLTVYNTRTDAPRRRYTHIATRTLLHDYQAFKYHKRSRFEESTRELTEREDHAPPAPAHLP